MGHPLTTTRVLAALAGSAACLLAACTAPGAAPGAGDPSGSTPEPGTGVPSPTVTRPAEQSVPLDVPPITVLTEDEAIELAPWAACWSGSGFAGCFDGAPVDPLPTAPQSEALYLTFPEADWTWSATLSTPGECGTRRVPAAVEPVAEGIWRVLPAGPAGAWDVELFGSGPSGDAIASIAWSTPTDGPVEAPGATATYLVDHDGVLDTYGTEILVTGLATTPLEASATLTVTAPDGTSLTSRPPLPEGWRDCSAWSQEGALFFSLDSPTEPLPGWVVGEEYVYRVDLVLDGTTYVGTGAWPGGTTSSDTLSVPLTWDPQLPGWDGQRGSSTGH